MNKEKLEQEIKDVLIYYDESCDNDRLQYLAKFLED